MSRWWIAVVGGVLALALIGAAAGQPSEGAEQAALAAAEQLFMASSAPDCITTAAPEQVCIQPSTTPSNAERGIATFSLGSPGGGGAMVVMAREPFGAWGYWFGTQNVVYQRLDLPGGMLVCADGDGANVRTAPSGDAAVIDTLPDLTRVEGEEFVLTQPGVVPDERQSGSTGTGWYRLSSPVAGWVAATLVTDATVDARIDEPPCYLRNLFVGDE